ncbi:MAG TPA: NAD(P)H-flavin reductase [Psychromonas hadalis]|nr:NAD(P)H-flavin reductase [Psychromonas hadalis]
MAKAVSCNVKNVEKVNDFLFRVFLIPSGAVSYKAGQYISVVMGEKDKRHFSIANGPVNATDIELHIGATPENSYAMQVIEKMQNEGVVDVEIANGNAFLQENSTRPIIILAGGTGFAYAKSLIEQAIALNLNNPIHLYWGVKKRSYLYFEDQANSWHEQHSNIEFKPVVELPEANWNGRTGYVHQAILNDFSDLSDFDIYVVGRFEMAKIARDDFTKQGAKIENIFGDAFAFI